MIQRRFTNEIAAMQPGSVRYGAFVNADGPMVDDGNVYRLAADRYWVMINSAGLQDWFRETGVGSTRRSTHERRTSRYLHPGPDVPGPVARPRRRRPVQPSYFRFWPDATKVAGRARARSFARGSSGEHGYELVTGPDSVGSVWDALIEAGERPFGSRRWNRAHRGGVDHHRQDYQPGETTPFDVSWIASSRRAPSASGPGRWVVRRQSPSKDQDPEVRGRPPEAGTAVTKQGAAVGAVTSPPTSPRSARRSGRPGRRRGQRDGSVEAGGVKRP